MNANETTLKIHKRNGQTYTATICGGTMRTSVTGDAVIDLADPTSNNAEIADIWHPHIAPAMRDTLIKQGVSNIDDIVCYYVAGGARGTWLCITDPADIKAIVPHVKAAMLARKAEWDRKREIESRTVRIVLTMCGWGDYGVCEWSGDITRDDAEILAECRAKIKSAHDPDTDPTDAEIIKMIAAARAKWQAENADRTAREEHKAECLRRAAEAGKRVAIRTYSCDCRDPQEECSLDIATVWAMPDGTVTTTYQHTW